MSGTIALSPSLILAPLQPLVTTRVSRIPKNRSALRPIGGRSSKDVCRERAYNGVPLSDHVKEIDILHVDDGPLKSKGFGVTYRETEIRVVHPIDCLEYSRDRVDFDILQEVRQIDLRRKENFVKMAFIGTKSAVVAGNTNSTGHWMVRRVSKARGTSASLRRTAMTRTAKCLSWLLASLCGIAAYEVPFADTDYSPQVCSGMFGGSNAFINVTFDDSSQGQLAMVIYEWKDVGMLGKVTSMINDLIPQKTYVCTSDAVKAGFCDENTLGKFIIDLPAGKSLNETSFWTARVGFRGSSNENSDADVFWYEEPINYPVRKTGFYCVAIVPVTVLPEETSVSSGQEDTDVSFHPSYSGVILFKNTFEGYLSASDYPKVNFYFAMLLLYAIMAAAWGWLCYRHREELLPIQYYLSSLIGLLVIEMVANFAYYRYLNAHGRRAGSTAFLIVVAILDAGRNALSFFLLLIVSLGLSVVRESLGPTMTKCKLLAAAHFVFGVLYSIGIVELELESTSAIVLLLFVVPLAFTLSGFLLWIMYALNTTISQLAARKQRYKLSMFRKLHRILIGVVIIISMFFVVSSLSFSNRLAEDFAANTWKVRWWLLDGWLALLYFAAFAAIAYLWRPNSNNRRLAMSDELAQEDEDAEDYDLEAIEARSHIRDEDDDATLIGSSRHVPNAMARVGEDEVVFEIGEHDEDDEPKTGESRKHIAQHVEDDRQYGDDTERQGLIDESSQRDRNG